MKLADIARHVVGFLRRHPEQEFTANTLLMHLGLPMREKRRIYDIVEILSSAEQVSIRRQGRKRYFRWLEVGPTKTTELVKLDLPEDPVFQEAGTVLHLLLQFGSRAFQELCNKSALEMLERDIKRTILGAQAVSVIRVTLKNNQGHILKKATTTGALPAAVF